MTPNRGIDADFLDLPRHELAEAALSAATAAGASHADLRIHRLSTEIIQLRDGELETAVVSREVGLAVRVIVDGTWGFASHAELAPAVAAETARRAVHVATTLATLNNERVELAPEPVYADATWVSSYRIDPFDVPATDKIAVLEDYSGRLLKPTASTTCRPLCTPSRSRRSTPTPSGRRSPSSACGCCRRWRR